ncbi:hypothetical protein BOW51_03955 [Solemya velesiana gill symbiont]|uniref:O-antigen ligase-related domain-containing protein n=2 Tax=Solemya velesiana gill symbiont TaxID=1918948 RepID=A0A1T2KWD1_9GAMM|nr:hypothetical protein BOW51_03955 [Solemya velesiana gill symbiont]
MQSVLDKLKIFTAILSVLIIAWSPFIGGPRLFAVLAAIVGFFYFVRKEWSLIRTNEERFLLYSFIAILIPTTISLIAPYSRESVIKVIVLVFIFYFCAIGITHSLKNRNTRELFEKGITVIACFWVFDALIQYAVGVDIIGVPLSGDGRVVGMFGDNLRYAAILPAILPIALWWLMKKYQFAAVTLYFASLFTVFASGYRAGWVMMAIVGIGFFVHLQIKHKRLVFLAFLILAILLASASPIVVRKFEATFDSLPTTTKQFNSILTGRIHIWSTALNMFSECPLAGVGVGAFDDAYGEYCAPNDPFGPNGARGRIANHAHQLYISLLAEAGIPGLLGFIAVVLYSIKRWYSLNISRKVIVQPYAWSLIAIIFPVNAQPILFLSWWFPVVIVVFSIFVGLIFSSETSRVSNSSGL